MRALYLKLLEANRRRRLRLERPVRHRGESLRRLRRLARGKKGGRSRGWPQRGPVAGTLEAAASGLYGGDVVTLQHVGIAMTKNLIQEQVGPRSRGGLGC